MGDGEAAEQQVERAVGAGEVIPGYVGEGVERLDKRSIRAA